MLQPDPALRHKAPESTLLRNLVFYLGTVSLKPFVPREYVLGPQRLNFFVKDKISSSQSCESPLGWRQFSRRGKESCGSPPMPGVEGGRLCRVEGIESRMRFFWPGIHRCLLLQRMLVVTNHLYCQGLVRAELSTNVAFCSPSHLKLRGPCQEKQGCGRR